MPAVVAVPIILESIGLTAAISSGVTAILGAEAAATAIIGTVTVGQVATGAIIGAGVGALNAAATGQDIGKGALFGAATGGVGSVVSGLAGPAFQAALGGTQAGNALASALTQGTRGLATGTLGGVLRGKDLGESFRAALPGAGIGALSAGLGTGFGLSKGEQALLSGGLSAGLGEVLRSQSETGAKAPASRSMFVPRGASTAAMGGALAASPGFSYTPSPTIFGASDKDEKPPSKVWNVSSLRELGSSVV